MPKIPIKQLFLGCLSLCVLIILAGCSGSLERDAPPEHVPNDLDKVPDAIPRVEKTNPAKQKTYTVLGKTYHPIKSSKDYVQRGIASWYGRKFHGRRTANGERYNMYAMTAAHKHLPLPTYVRVKNLENGRSVVVRVNDRGPFHSNRIIDLSYTAAHKLGMLKKGVVRVEIRAIDPRNPQHKQPRPVNKPTPVPNTRVYIQAGAFGQVQNARRLQQKLQQKLQRQVSIEATQTAQGKLSRVIIGPLASHEVAQQVTQQLLDINIHDSKLIVR